MERVELWHAAIRDAEEYRYQERKQLANMIANEVIRRFK